MSITAIGVTSAVAFVASAVVLAGLFRCASRLGLCAPPGPGKLQRDAIPLIGGSGVFAGILAGVTAALGVGWLPLTTALWQGVGLLAALAAIGLIDDRRPLNARSKAAWTGSALVFWAWLAGIPASHWGMLPVAFFLLHAFNLVDHANGVCAGVSVLGAAAVGVLGGLGLVAKELTLVGVAMGAGLLPFLRYNFPAGRAFLGDSGSLLLGGFFAWGVLQTGHPGWLVLAALPFADATTVMWLRWRRGQPVWIGDLGHVTHRLAARVGGLTRAAAWLLAVATAWTFAGARLTMEPATWTSWALAGAALMAAALAVLAITEVPTQRRHERQQR